MSPIVKPTKQAERQQIREASEAYAEARRLGMSRDDSIEIVEHRHPALFTTTRDRSVYGPGSPHSYFRDLAVVLAADQQRDWMPTPAHEGVRARLATVETRTLSTTATAGGGFVPPGPSYIAEEFAAAVRAASKMTGILPQNPLPETGIFNLTTPRITTGDTVAIQTTQNSTISNQDLVESNVVNPVGTIAGYVDMSQALLDHSLPGIDTVLAAELGRAYGTQVDTQILRGTGANGQMLGLASVTGITSDSYADITPTQAEAWAVLTKLYGDVSTAIGDTPEVLLLHPRRAAWFSNWRDSSTGMQSNLNWPCPMVQVPAVATTDGGSTNADEIYVLKASELPIYMTDPKFLVAFDQAGSNTLTVRFRVYGYVSALFTRRPEAIGRSTGTGWTAPVFS